MYLQKVMFIRIKIPELNILFTCNSYNNLIENITSLQWLALIESTSHKQDLNECFKRTQH